MQQRNRRMNDKELEKYQALLCNKRKRIGEQVAVLIQELADYSQPQSADSAFSLHMGDAASLTVGQEHIRIMLQQYYNVLQNIEAALNRIKDKTYGFCRITGKRIEKERLNAIPETDIANNI